MKKAVKITLITIAIVIAVMILASVIFFVVASKQPMVKEGYYNDVKTSAQSRHRPRGYASLCRRIYDGVVNVSFAGR